MVAISVQELSTCGTTLISLISFTKAFGHLKHGGAPVGVVESHRLAVGDDKDLSVGDVLHATDSLVKGQGFHGLAGGLIPKAGKTKHRDVHQGHSFVRFSFPKIHQYVKGLVSKQVQINKKAVNKGD